MPQSAIQTEQYAQELKKNHTIDDFKRRLEERIVNPQPLPERIPSGNDCSSAGVERRRSPSARICRTSLPKP
jgi:hypothetical protein